MTSLAATNLPAPGANRRFFLRSSLMIAALAYGLIPLAIAQTPYWINVMTNVALLAFASLGVWLTFAIGRVNIAQGAFCLVGGCVTGVLSTFYAMPFWLCLPISAAAAAILAFLIGWPLLRLRGIYFAMVTLSLTEAMRLVFLNLGSAVGGGIVNIPRPAALGTAMAFYLFAATLLILGYAVVWRFSTSRFGAIFRSMRQDEDLAMSIGIDVAKYRVLAFVVSSAMGGIAGSCFAVLQQNVYPASYTVADSINFMLYCFLGGLDFVLGPIVGAFALILTFELLRAFPEHQALLYGVLMIAAMLFLPNGLLSIASSFGRRRGGKP